MRLAAALVIALCAVVPSDARRSARTVDPPAGSVTVARLRWGGAGGRFGWGAAWNHDPIAFMWEPGFWQLTDREAASFRDYLLKGGFAVFEDFDGPAQWQVFEAQMRRVLPDHRLVELDRTHPIFDGFFRIKDIDAIRHPMYGLRPRYFGVYEANDPGRRLMAVANFDNDVPEYWEWSGQGLFPFDTSNEAYKLGVNYLIYGLTR
jgi:hypothetical protein